MARINLCDIVIEVLSVNMIEDITPQGHQKHRIIKIAAKNKSNFDINWLRIECIEGFSYDTEGTSSRIVNGTEHYSTHKYKHEYWKKRIFLIEHIKSNTTVEITNKFDPMELKDPNKYKHFIDVKPFQVLGESATGEKFNFIYFHDFKMNDDYIIIDKDSSCFVATATCGNPDHFIVKSLQNFRDTMLRKTILGNKFIALYYYHGPQLAQKISKSNLYKFHARLLLWPIAFLAKTALSFYNIYCRFKNRLIKDK